MSSTSLRLIGVVVMVGVREGSGPLEACVSAIAGDGSSWADFDIVNQPWSIAIESIIRGNHLLYPSQHSRRQSSPSIKSLLLNIISLPLMPAGGMQNGTRSSS